MLKSDLTAIIPMDLSQRPYDLIRKAQRLCKAAEHTGLKLIFGHNDRGTLADSFLKTVVRRHACATLVSDKFYNGEVNTSLLRNKAFDRVSTDYLVLLDVDIWPDIQMLFKYQQKVFEGSRPFYFLPCLYLTPRGSKNLAGGKTSPKELAISFFGFSRKEFLHLASPSSITVMRSADYLAVGCFDELYTGHGYEDFDFMMRLANHFHCLTPCAKILDNSTARSPLFTTGFRRALGRLCLQALLDKDFVYHLHHAKPKASKYYLARTDNYARFSKLHKPRESAVSESSTLLEDFLNLCRESNNNFHDYSALFENKPGHVDRYDTFKRRLRFLLNE